MRGVWIRWLTTTLAILLTPYLVDGIRVDGFMSAFFAAAVLGILNAFLRPLVLILTLPLTILTLGLFTFVINAAILKMASGLIPGFYLQGFWSAVFGSLVISLVSWLVNTLIDPRGRVVIIRQGQRGDAIDKRP
jgi:putative membrane protein